MGTNKDNLLEEFISRYLTKSEAEEFYSQFRLHIKDFDKLSSKISGIKDGNLDSFNSFYTNTQVDLLTTFAEQKFSVDKKLGLLSFLGDFSITKGEPETALNIFNRILELTEGEEKYADIKANANLSIGEIFSRQAKWKNSIKYIKRALALFNVSKNPNGVAKCHNLFGTIYGDMGNVAKAREYFEYSFELLKHTNDISLLGMVEINLGIMNLIMEDFKNALLYLKRAQVSFKRISNYKRIAEIHYNTGMVYSKMEDYTSALSEFDESLAIAERLGYLNQVILCFQGKAHIYIKQNDNNLASAFADRSMELAYKLNDKLSVADIYKLKGVIHRNLNNYTAAENCFLTSLRINKEVSNKYNYAETSFELGLLYKELGNTGESTSHLNNARKYFKSIKAFDELKKVETFLN